MNKYLENDGLGAVDCLYDPAPLQAGHYIVIALIIVVICFGVFCFFTERSEVTGYGTYIC